MFAAFGFCLADIFNRGKFRFQLSPVYMAIVAFCFSMTTGVLWEFIEFFIDRSLGMDMQKDTLLQGIISVTFDKTNSNIPIHMDNITQTIICMEDGSQYIIQGGYLDVGLFDTMKDLLVNFAGALVFSIFGFFYVKQKGKGKVASQFIPVYVGKEEDADHAALPEAEAVTKDAPTADNRDA